MRDIYRVAVQFLLSIGLPLAMQLWDRKRLNDAQVSRLWNCASWGAALYAFGPLSMIGWFWVTRRWRGLPLGIGSALLILVAVYAFDCAVLSLTSEVAPR